MYDVVHLGSGTEAGSYVRGAKIWKKKITIYNEIYIYIYIYIYNSILN